MTQYWYDVEDGSYYDPITGKWYKQLTLDDFDIEEQLKFSHDLADWWEETKAKRKVPKNKWSVILGRGGFEE